MFLLLFTTFSVKRGVFFSQWYCHFKQQINSPAKLWVLDVQDEEFLTITSSRQNFIALFVHSTFTVRSQNMICLDYNWLSHHQQNTKNDFQNEAVILNYELVVTQFAIAWVINPSM